MESKVVDSRTRALMRFELLGMNILQIIEDIECKIG